MPWKQTRSLLMKIPGAADPRRIRTDLAHTWAIGVGKEFCASALISLCDMGLLRGRSLEAKLADGYAKFREWCHATQQGCKISEFSKKQLKIPNGWPGRGRRVFHHVRRSRSRPRLHHGAQVAFGLLGAGQCE